MGMRRHGTGAAALVDLFLTLFGPYELRRFIHELPSGESISYGLPGRGVSPASLAFETAQALFRFGLVDDMLFDALVKERPNRRADIDDVRMKILGHSTQSVDTQADARYDFFLAHTSADKPQVHKIYELLRARGLTAFFEEASIVPGDDWALEIQRALQRSRILVVCISRKNSRSLWIESEIRAFKLSKQDKAHIVPVFLDGWTKDVPAGLFALQGLDCLKLGMDRVADALVEFERFSKKGDP